MLVQKTVELVLKLLQEPIYAPAYQYLNVRPQTHSILN